MTTKRISAALLSIAISASAVAQTIKTSNTHIGLLYPISTNGVHAAEYTNTFSAHAISGVSYSEKAFCASGVASVIKDSATGLVASGFANVIGNKATGVQAAGFINYAGNYTNGVQSAGFMNYSGGVKGVQTAGFANIATKEVDGLQAAGFVNIAKNATCQAGGFINIADTNRCQLAGFINIAGSTRGAQVAGFVNVAEDVEGAQIGGFVNIARKVKGVQIAGFINIADSSDCPIGLINIIKNGEKHIGVMVDETGTTFATFRSGGRTLYGIVGFGFNGSNHRAIFATQAGIGAHMPLSKTIKLNGEATATSLADFRRTADMQAGIKIFPSYRVRNFEIFAGPSFNYAMSMGFGTNGGAPFNHNSIWTSKSYNRTHELYIGGQVGVQLRF